MTVASWKTNVFVVWAWTSGPNSLQRRQEASAASPPLAALPDPCRWCQAKGERPTWRQRSHLHELRAELLRGPKISTATKPEESAVIQPLKDSQCSKIHAGGARSKASAPHGGKGRTCTSSGPSCCEVRKSAQPRNLKKVQ